ATGGPAGPIAQVIGVNFRADINRAERAWPLDLRVAAQTEIRVAHRQELRVDRPGWVVTGGATLPQSRMFESDRLRFHAMTLGAGFIAASHGQAAGRFHDVHAVRIMALDAVHF